MVTKLYFDTEFTGLHKNTTLISIGIKSECGARFYAELTDYDKSQIDEWLQKHVLDNLNFKAPAMGEDDYIFEYYTAGPTVKMRCNSERLKSELTKWLDLFEGIEVKMVSDCLSYDWVLFNHIFGHAFNIPKHVNYIPYDICTAMEDLGIDPDISREEFISDMEGDPIEGEKHNALYDAEVIEMCDIKLRGLRALKNES